jgi:hypothetical protein
MFQTELDKLEVGNLARFAGKAQGRVIVECRCSIDVGAVFDELSS